MSFTGRQARRANMGRTDRSGSTSSKISAMERPASTTTSSESAVLRPGRMFDIAKTTFESQRTILKGTSAQNSADHHDGGQAQGAATASLPGQSCSAARVPRIDTAIRVLSRPRHTRRYAATSATAPKASRVRRTPDFGAIRQSRSSGVMAQRPTISPLRRSCAYASPPSRVPYDHIEYGEPRLVTLIESISTNSGDAEFT